MWNAFDVPGDRGGEDGGQSGGTDRAADLLRVLTPSTGIGPGTSWA